MDGTNNVHISTKNAIEVISKLSVIGIMVVWSLILIKPFLTPVIWGVILAVGVEPFITRVAKRIGNRRTLAAALFVVTVFAAMVIPSILLVSSSIDTVQTLTVRMQDKSLAIPPPPASVADWPIAGDAVHKSWSLAATNLEGAIKEFAPELKIAAEKILGSVGGSLIGLFMVIMSILIAGVLLAKGEESALLAKKIIVRFTGDRGPEIASLATATIRGVMQGVVGVAFIQAALSAIGMIAVGVPAAGLWAVLVLVCAVAQLPPILVLGPVAAYVFSVAGTTTAVIFLVWSILIVVSDSFLKPLLMGRGVEIPMLVILIGALGGMLASGILGLFVGAVVLAIMYTLFMAWLDEDDELVHEGPER